jgi:uncharacterized protein (TIGR03435 family)
MAGGHGKINRAPPNWPSSCSIVGLVWIRSCGDLTMRNEACGLVCVRIVALVLGLTLTSTTAQSSTGKFEVVSIKPCKNGPAAKGEGRTEGSGGRLTVECATLDNLIRDSYVLYADGMPARFNRIFGLHSDIRAAVRSQKITGSHGWIGSDRFTINAKAEGPAILEMMRGPMMRAVLEDRFKLKVHRETREFPIYELTVAKERPSLRLAKEGGCIFQDPATGPPRRTPGQLTPPIICGGYSRSSDGSGLDVHGVSLSDLCRLFTVTLNRDVIDKTTIAGVFDIHLDLTFADILSGGGRRDTADGSTEAAPNDPAGSIAAALRKFGLKLEPAKMRAEFLVIDHAEKPTEN